MICRVEEAKHEMESRLDSQRRHMVQKESILQNEIEELKVNTIPSLLFPTFSPNSLTFCSPSSSLFFYKCRVSDRWELNQGWEAKQMLA